MTSPMRIALIADAFPPLRTSGAVQLRDLAHEWTRQGHKVTVMVPAASQAQPWLLEDMNNVEVLRLKAPRTKGIGYVRRTINELLMPFSMLRSLRKSPLGNVRWDGVVWYSPTIFLGPMANALKKRSDCPSYLIVRDIFPEWAADIGLMRRGMPYLFFKTIERYQYSVANVIGVQSPSNLHYFEDWASQSGRRVEVLPNWLTEAPDIGCSLSVADGPLAGRTIFVYAGNMGVAQGMGILTDLAERLHSRPDVGFVFVGRGSEAKVLRQDAEARGLDNIVFYDEVEPAEIPGLYAQCHVGIVALDPRHKTHNIPGKFVSYMQGGLPVLASINPGNDLAQLIEREQIGRACIDHSADTLRRMAEDLVTEIQNDPDMPARCRALAAKLFSSQTVAKQLTAALSPQLAAENNAFSFGKA